ncbi:MAG: hypothetical protein NC408_04475 [Candidatus Gastranaerophilales bacterium]|nr:hypothetical protein [Candidatus Gastranaerophilales bacterium]MCM1072273.1 hypothetical protein [Bacteroides sp.]
MDYNEFSEKIKAKYPQYKDMDNRELAQRMVAKYPQYNDVTFDDTVATKSKQGLHWLSQDEIKANAQRNLDDRAHYESEHPVLSRLQKDFDPSYRAQQSRWEKQAEYGRKAPLKEELKDFGAGLASPFIPAANIVTSIATGGIGGTAKGFLPSLGRGAAQGAIQGAVSEGLNELGDNGLSTNILTKTATGGIGGGLGGGTLQGGGYALGQLGNLASKPLKYIGGKVVQGITDLKPETLAQLVKPNSQALDLTEEGAQNLLMNTTERIQKDYASLMDAAGRKVQEAALRLPEDRGVFASSLKNSLDDIYAGYSTSGNKTLNVAYNKAGNIYDNINNLVDNASNIPDIGTISAPKLNDIMNNIKSYNIKWDDPNAQLTNGILKQIYGDYARRLGNLSPELRKANKTYSQLANFEDNEGVRRILQPAKTGDLDIPSSALRNYNSTVTKGNTSRNIQDLENILVENGKQPFLNDVDDVNAAMDLLTSVKNGRNFLGATTLAKGLATPALKAVRELNRSGLPEIYARMQQQVPESVRRLLTPLAVRGANQMLYGGVSNYE